MIKESYCSYELSKLLKEKGFDELCNHYYFYRRLKEVSFYERNSESDYLKEVEHCTAPTHQMAMAWLREKGICIEPYAAAFRYGFTISKVPTGSHICNELDCYPDDEFETYEEAVEAACLYVLKNLI